MSTQIGQFRAGKVKPRVFLFAPIDWGIAFALSQKWTLMQLVSFPIVLELIGGYLRYSRPLLQHHSMLILITAALSNVWLICATLMLAIELLRGEAVKVGEIARKAFYCLPKIFVSWLFTFAAILAGAGLFVIPGLLFLSFFMWAPAFCIGEEYASKDKQDDNHALLDRSERGGAALQPWKFFTNMAPWDLGLVRSSRLSGSCFMTTVQLAILMLASFAIPVAFVELIVTPAGGFSYDVLVVVITSIAKVFVIAVWAGAFLMLLPKEAQAEIGVDPSLERMSFLKQKTLKQKTGKIPRYFEGRLVLNLILVVLTIASGMYFVLVAKSRTQMPSTVVTEVLSTETQKDTFILNLRLTDIEQEFRWLVPLGFRVFFELTEQVDDSTQSAALLSDSTYDAKAVEPFRVDLFGEDGLLLSENNFAPYSKPVRLVLHFQLPERVRKKGNFVLKYESLIGLGDEVYRGPSRQDW